MVFKMIITMRKDKGNDKKALKRPFLQFYIVFITSIQYESKKILFDIEMDDKKDIKGEFSILYLFLSYLPSFPYCFMMDKVNFLISTDQFETILSQEPGPRPSIWLCQGYRHVENNFSSQGCQMPHNNFTK